MSRLLCFIWFFLYFLLSYHSFSHGFILPSHHSRKKEISGKWDWFSSQSCRSVNDSVCVEHKCRGACLCTMSVAWPERLPRPFCCADPSFWWEVVDRVEVSAVWVFVLKRDGEGKSLCLSIISSAPSTKWTKVWLFSCYSVMIHGKHLPESAPGFFGLRAKCPCECNLCACLQQFHECISVWQMWQIFHGSHKSAHISLISGAHRLLSLLITRKGKRNATHDWTYMCTHDIHKMQNTRKQMNKA